MKINIENYKEIRKIDMVDPRLGLVRYLNKIALPGMLISIVIGLILNYCLRMLGQPGGFYAIYAIAGFVLCLIYIYLHELTHAVSIVLIKHIKPKIKFGLLVASCGVENVYFNKFQYFIVAVMPLFLFCVALIPLCVLLPPIYFPLPFMPLCYNIFGSLGDVYMIRAALTAPKNSVISDSGTVLTFFTPITHE